MTVERKIVVGLEDIRFVTLECLECHARTTLLPDKLAGVPYACPTCRHPWRKEINPGQEDIQAEVEYFIKSIPIIRRRLKEETLGFRILMEFNEP